MKLEHSKHCQVMWPFYWHVNSCFPSDHMESGFFSCVLQNFFWSYPSNYVCIISVWSGIFVKYLWNCLEHVHSGFIECKCSESCYLYSSWKQNSNPRSRAYKYEKATSLYLGRTYWLYEGHLESKERFAIQRYLFIIGKKKNMQVLWHTFTYFST